MRRSIIISAVLAAMVLTAVLSVPATEDGAEGGTRSLPVLSSEYEEASGVIGSTPDVDSVPVSGETAESVTEDRETPEDVAEDTETPEHVAEDRETAEPVTDNRETAEPATENRETAEPAAENRETPEPAAENRETPEPVPERTETPEPVPERTETPEPMPERTETPEPMPERTETPEPAPERTETPEPVTEHAETPEPVTEHAETPESAAESGGPDAGPIDITMERPPFDGHYLCPSLADTAESAVPVALVLRSVSDSAGSSREWMDDHWAEWMEDPRFAAEQEADLHILLDQDQRYSYILDGDSVQGQGIAIYDNATQEPAFFVDLFSYLFQDNAAAAASDGTNAQSLRWARILNGKLFFSNASSLCAEKMGGRNAYLTAIDPWTGLLLWRTDPLVCGSANFAVPGPADSGVILCGGGDGQAGFLYQVGMKTGEILDRTPLDSVPEWIVCANGAACVYSAGREYVFDIQYS